MHAVDVWFADPDTLAAPERWNENRALLAADELARLDAHPFERGRRLYLATRVLARTTLSHYLPVDPASWRFTTNPHGRPEIAAPSSCWRFNLSNTQGLVVCAITRDADVGVDVEWLGREAPLEIADRFFAAAEVAALEALAPPDRQRRFFDYWTLKESYIKARGLGLALPLDRFWFVVDRGRAPRLHTDPTLGDDGEAWQFAQHQPTPHHLVSLCVRRQSPLAADREVSWHPLTHVSATTSITKTAAPQ